MLEAMAVVSPLGGVVPVVVLVVHDALRAAVSQPCQLLKLTAPCPSATPHHSRYDSVSCAAKLQMVAAQHATWTVIERPFDPQMDLCQVWRHRQCYF